MSIFHSLIFFKFMLEIWLEIISKILFEPIVGVFFFFFHQTFYECITFRVSMSTIFKKKRPIYIKVVFL